MKLANLFVTVVVYLVFFISVPGQYFTLPGAHFYALNSSHQVLTSVRMERLVYPSETTPVNTHPTTERQLKSLFGPLNRDKNPAYRLFANRFCPAALSVS